MRIILYSLSFTLLASFSAFSDEASSLKRRFQAIPSYNNKYLPSYYSNNQNNRTYRFYQISENNEIKKFSRQIKKNTSSEGSVELIEMIKNAKSKKDARKPKS